MSSDSYPVIPRMYLPTPGHCFKCGSNERDCIDLGFNAEYYGAVLLCIECGHELVNVDELEFVDKNTLRGLEDDSNTLSIVQAAIREAVEDHGNAVESANSAFVNRLVVFVADDRYADRVSVEKLAPTIEDGILQ